MSGKRASSKALALDAALVRLAGRGVRPRCGEPGAHQLFLSDKADDRALAATWCAGCPVLTECGAAGIETQATFGVWGGVDRTVRPDLKYGRGRLVPTPVGEKPVANQMMSAVPTAADTACDTAAPSPRRRRRASSSHPTSAAAALTPAAAHPTTTPEGERP